MTAAARLLEVERQYAEVIHELSRLTKRREELRELRLQLRCRLTCCERIEYDEATNSADHSVFAR